MRAEFAGQYQVVCLVIEEGDTFEDVMNYPQLDEAMVTHDGIEYCVRFPGRPQELYTSEALRRSFQV